MSKFGMGKARFGPMVEVAAEALARVDDGAEVRRFFANLNHEFCAMLTVEDAELLADLPDRAAELWHGADEVAVLADALRDLYRENWKLTRHPHPLLTRQGALALVPFFGIAAIAAQKRAEHLKQTAESH